ncbi:MAG: hypothetical protein NT015_07395 [Alphaproteobacteria bacterium]|nr:hypothetical protein [Alphaproteobacteria bacterium]
MSIRRGLPVIVGAVALTQHGPLSEAEQRLLHATFKQLRAQFPKSPLQVVSVIENQAAVELIAIARQHGFDAFALRIDASAGEAGSPFAPLENDAAVEEARAIAEAAVRGQALAPIATVLRRMAHILIAVERPAETPAAVGQSVLDAWINPNFDWSDCEDDPFESELITPPLSGPLCMVTGGGGRARAMWRGIGRGGEWVDVGRSMTNHPWMEELASIERVNKLAGRIDPTEAKKCRDSLLSDDQWAVVEESDAVRSLSEEARSRFLAELGHARDIFGECDARAIKTKRRMEALNLFFASSVPLAVLAYEVLGNERPRLAIIAYLVIIVAAMIVGFVLAGSTMQRRFQDLRHCAELVRIGVFLSIAGFSGRMQTIVTRWLPERLLISHFCARALDDVLRHAPPPTQSLTDFVQTAWIGPSRKAPRGPRSFSTQSVWYAQKSDYHRRRHWILDAWQQTILALALIAAAVLLALPEMGWGGLPLMFAAVAISFLPATAGAISIVRERMSHQALGESYEKMAYLAERASALLDRHREDPKRRALVVRDFGVEVTGECIQWLLASRRQRIEARAG